MPNKTENNGKYYEARRQFAFKTFVLMGANNDKDTMKAVDEVIDFQYKIHEVSLKRYNQG